MATAFELTDSDRHILSLTDDQFILHDWDNLVSIIGNSLHTVITTTTTPYIHTLYLFTLQPATTSTPSSANLPI